MLIINELGFAEIEIESLILRTFRIHTGLNALFSASSPTRYLNSE